MSLLYFLNRGDDKSPAQYPLEPLNGKKEVSVAVVVSTQPGMSLTDTINIGLDRELTERISEVLTTETKGSKVPIRTLDYAKVTQVRNSNPSLWETGSRNELATKLGVDYVLDVYVRSFSLNSRDYADEITTGSASYFVSVFRAGKEAPALYTDQNQFNPDFRDARSMDRNSYRYQFVGKLAQDIARKYVSYTPDRNRTMDR